MHANLSPGAPLADRILALSIIVQNGCWNWRARIDRWGYGHIRIRQITKLAHRAAYEEFIGAIPLGMQLDHLCKNTRCCNPAHLEIVTPTENALRSTCVAARIALTHCKYGHPLSGINVRISGNSRICRACDRRRHKELIARRRLGGKP